MRWLDKRQRDRASEGFYKEDNSSRNTKKDGRTFVMGVVILQKGIVLVRQLDAGSDWRLPGNGLSNDEDPCQAFRKIINKKIGLAIHNSHICLVKKFTKGRYTTFFYFARRNTEKVVDERRGNYEIRVVPIAELLMMNDFFALHREQVVDEIARLAS
jgi:ADP-ribose pyrophosphatase YjhB (NUDIX family)